MSLNDTAPTLVADTAWTRNNPHDTERQAAAVAALSTRSTKTRALLLFEAAGDPGLTDDELSAELDRLFPRADGFPHNPSKIASRRKELEENRFPDGEHGPALVEPTGDERPTRRGVNARVFRITVTGRRALESIG